MSRDFTSLHLTHFPPHSPIFQRHGLNFHISPDDIKIYFSKQSGAALPSTLLTGKHPEFKTTLWKQKARDFVDLGSSFL